MTTMFARVGRPLLRTATRFTSTTASRRATLSSHYVNQKNQDQVSRNEAVKGIRSVFMSNDTKVPGNPEPRLSGSSSFLDVRIPPPEMDSEPPIQVPYVPDFWDSPKLSPDISFTEAPKVVVVGGTETSHGSARPQSLEDIDVLLESDSTQVPQKTGYSASFLDDIAEDLHLPPIQDIKSGFRKIFS